VRFTTGTWIKRNLWVLLLFSIHSSLFAQSTLSPLAPLSHLESLAATRYGDQAVRSVNQWRLLLDSSQSLSEQEKLQRINRFFNLHVYYDEDRRIWQKADYWATPLETLARARGDCEDFTIAKYVSLRLLNVPANKLKLTYVNLISDPEDKAAQQHMVLAYYPSETADPLILDNLKGQILPASSRPELKPVFSFNDEKLWVAGIPRHEDPQQQLGRWRDVLTRIHQDGL